MATVDLDNSERSLMQALIRKSLMGQRNDSTRFRLNAINAKLVAPVAPAPGLREAMGKVVRDEWVRYCIETGDTKPSHIAPWEELSEWDKEADRRIADAVLSVLAERGVR